MALLECSGWIVSRAQRRESLMFAQRLTILCFAASCAWLASCSGPNAQLLQYQKEKEQLTEVIRSQRETNTALKDRAESLTKRLDEAEKELAIAQGRGTRLARSEPAATSTTPSTATPIREPAAPSGSGSATKAAPQEKLPWRPARTGSKPPTSNSSENR
jgi:hypothetical protein